MALQTPNRLPYAGYEIISVSHGRACFVERDALDDFEYFTDISEQALFWAAADSKTVHFDEQEWTVGFLPHYDPGSNPNGYQGQTQEGSTDLASAK